MKISLTCAGLGALLALIVIPVHADPGHKHGAGGSETYSGHAAALGEPGDPKVRARTINIGMSDDMKFLPAQVTVARGETIRFVVKNGGLIKHEMTLGTMAELVEHAQVMAKFPEMEHDDPNAASVDPGKSKTILWKFTKAGSFDFACLIPGHMDAGMKGRIVVQ